MPGLAHISAATAARRPDWRYAFQHAIIGSTGALAAAAAQFAAALLVLVTSSAADFGLFSLLMVLIQLSFGLSNALIGATLAVIPDNGDADRQRRAILSAHLLLLLGAALGIGLFGWLLAADGDAVAAFVALAVLGNLRWTARAWAIAERDVARSARSDIGFACAVVTILALAVASNAATLTGVVASLALAHATALAISSRAYLAAQFDVLGLPSLRTYAREIWPGQSRWATLGVVTTEASSNVHAYLVAWMFGASGFAVIALGALFWRPLTVVLTALNQIDRPRFARRIDRGTADGMLSASLPISALAWLINAALAIAAFWIFSKPIAARGYDLEGLSLVVAIWSAIMALRAARNPISTLLQAGRCFRPLAYCSLASAVASIVAVAGSAQLGPNQSLFGIVIGEAVLLWLVVRLARGRA